MSTVRCTSLESYRVSIVISCLLILKYCLYIRRFVQNILEQMILLNRKGNHISVLTAARDIHVPLMWSTIASPSILIYSCGGMWWDAVGWVFPVVRRLYLAVGQIFFARVYILVFFVHLRLLYYILCIIGMALYSLISCHPVAPSLLYHFIPMCVLCKFLSLAFASSIVSVSSLIQALSSILFMARLV